MMHRNSLRAGIIVMMVTVFFAGSARAAVPMVTYTDLYTLGLPTGLDSIAPQSAVGGQVVGWGSGTTTGNNNHAVLWTPSATSGIDLNPSGFTTSLAYGTSPGAPGQQVGSGYGSATGNDHALLWNGSAASFVDLNPSGFAESSGNGTSGTQQVGSGYGSATGDNTHALLWNGSAASYVDINPTGFDYSVANGTNGTQQVGWGSGPTMGDDTHALLWNGSAASFVDLNPDGFTISYADSTNGTQQVGSGYGSVTGYAIHALLWNGSADSYVDLNPSGFTESEAFGTSGTQQVGEGTPPTGGDHALLWSGSADSYVDLNAFLPESFGYSVAYSIDGNTIYGLAEDTGGNYHAIEWNIVPEPGSFSMLAIAGIGLLCHRRRAQAGSIGL